MAPKWGESQSRFLKKEDIGEATPNVTIESVSWDEIGDEKEKKPVIYFVGKTKGLVCNKTMQDELTDLFGDPPALSEDDAHLTRWLKGNTVQLYVDHKVKFAGKRVGGLRLRGVKSIDTPEAEEPPPHEHQEEPPLPDDEIPF